MTLRFVARTVRGIEGVAASEIHRTLRRAADTRLMPRQVEFTLPEVDEALLALRTVDDVFVRLGVVPGLGRGREALDVLRRGLRGIDVRAALDTVTALRAVPRAPRFDVVASLVGQRSYNRYALENVVGDVVARPLRGAYVARGVEDANASALATVDLTLRLFVAGDQAELTMRLGRRPSHRRGYKTETGAGSLHPPVAAAMAEIVRTDTPAPTILDPFCGDGTIVIELALADPSARIVGADLDASRLVLAGRNAARARLAIDFVRADAAQSPWRGVDTVVTNPPWGRTVAAGGSLDEALERFWDRLPASLSDRGGICLIVDSDLDVPSHLSRRGYSIGLAQLVRLRGHLSHIVLASPPGAVAVSPRPEVSRWLALVPLASGGDAA